MRHYVEPDGLPPANGYSHAVAFAGPFITVAGQVPLDADGRLVGRGDPEAQMRQVFHNLSTALAAAEATMQHVVKLTVYLTDMANLDAFRRVRDEFITLGPPPASTLVQVARLVNPEFLVEVDALAGT